MNKIINLILIVAIVSISKNTFAQCNGSISTIGTSGVITLSSSIGTSITTNYNTGNPNATIAINGIFQIDNSFTITDANIVLSPGAEIQILTNKTLTIEQSWLHACQNYMWESIKILDGNSTLNVLNHSLIEDAKTAVVSLNGGKYSINNSILNKNYVHLQVKDFSSTHSGSISGSRLTCENASGAFSYNLLPPYAGKRTLIGVEVRSVGRIIIGSASLSSNAFQNLECGLFLRDCNAEIYNNQFHLPKTNLQTVQFVDGEPLNGVGIYKTNSLYQDGLPNDFIVGGVGFKKNKFYECPSGIRVTGHPTAINLESGYSNCHILYNEFDDVGEGIFLDLNLQVTPLPFFECEIEIDNNIITNFKGMGIKCINVTESRLFTISNNTITACSTCAILPGLTLYGILVSGSSSISGRYIKNLDINNNWIYQCGYGIRLQTINPAKAFPSKVRNNHIFHDRQTYPSNVTTQGIWINNSGKFTFEDNIFTRTTPDQANEATYPLYGFDGDFLKTSTFKDNVFLDYGRGARLRNQLSKLVLRCNYFEDCYYGYTLGNGAQSATLFNQGTATSGNDDHWNYPSNISALRVTGLTNTFTWYHRNNNIINNIYFPENNIFNISLSPNANGNSNCQTISNNTVECIDIESIVKDNIKYDNYELENKWWAKLFAYQAMVENADLQTCGVDFLQFYQNLSNSNFEHFASIRTNMESNNVATAQSINASIVPTNQIESNLKTVNTIFLNTWAVGIMEFTSGQYGELQNIACLTTLEGGPAVADARLLLGLSDMDDFECGLRIGATKDEKKKSLLLYPNPASEDVTIVSEFDFNELILLDLSGRIIEKYFFSDRENNVKVSVKDLTKGVYYLKISNASEVEIQKLIVN